MGSYVICFCGGVATLLLGMAAGVKLILFYKERMCRPPEQQRKEQENRPHKEAQERRGEENAPRGGAHAAAVGRWNWE